MGGEGRCEKKWEMKKEEPEEEPDEDKKNLTDNEVLYGNAFNAFNVTRQHFLVP